MGTDTPVAVLSQRPRMLYDYFHQLFAQVTNPPLDAIREEVVTSLQGTTGGERDLLNPTAESCHQILLQQPILRNHELAKLINLNPDDDINGRSHGMCSKVIHCLYPVAEGGAGLAAALEKVRAKASAAIADGARVIILSDRESNGNMAPIPALLAVAGVHHHLVRTGPDPCRSGGRNRRRPRGAPHGGADRLRRRSGQPVPGLRVDRGHARPRCYRRDRPR